MTDATAAAIWHELLAGEWVVLDRKEESLRRTLVLRKATAEERPSCAFSEVERDVLTMAMRAWSLKMMSAELGLGTSRVAGILGRIRDKLGAPTHADLLRLVGSFIASDDGATPLGHRGGGAPSAEEKCLRKRTLTE